MHILIKRTHQIYCLIIKNYVSNLSDGIFFFYYTYNDDEGLRDYFYQV